MKNIKRKAICGVLAAATVAAVGIGASFANSEIVQDSSSTTASRDSFEQIGYPKYIEENIEPITLALPTMAEALIAQRSQSHAPASRSIGRIPLETRAVQRPVVTPLIESPIQAVDIQVWPRVNIFGVLYRDPEYTTDTEFPRADPIQVDLKLEYYDNNWVRVADTDYWLPLDYLSLTAPILGPAGNRDLGRQMAAERGWTGEQWVALERLWTRESNWNHLAANPISTARGIPQKMMSIHYGRNWRTSENAAQWLSDPEAQITWGLNYIQNRYGTPARAWAHFLRHGWY